ncbi:glycosyltransferase family 4 protein [Polynucleobacter sp. AP-Nino-20-G2]|uniref:glycosyltransferase family 4 protein n=1 Tax=Polynucleobacter sp. AP-Nino-20-G2 TaxID=2576917 RepID=UPI001BFDCC62|nr:glycosyltransferase family 4 protein [Polynucleobacter sp. AP-Nino-20-G2]QWE16963.1 glycosyltransferase family 4 protein [Polynucleobacter sp. AP-Nino-20-G2]
MLNQSKNIFNSGKTIFSAVMDGKVTGQINTARFLLKILGENIDESRLVLLEQPEKSKMFFFNWVKYLANFAKTSYFNNIKCVYIVANRTRKSFWFRDLFPLTLAYFSGAKLFYHIVGNDFRDFIDSLSAFERKFFFILVSKNTCTFVVLGSRMEDEVNDTISTCCPLSFEKEFIHLPAFISNGSIDGSKEFFESAKINSTITLGFMSNLIPEKGFNYFLEACTLFLRNHPDCQVWIAGPKFVDGHYELLDELVDQKRITYYPYLDGDRKWQVLSKTDIFALPTFYKAEYLPLSILDAMLCGCYVISCDTGDISKYIYEFNGALVDKESVTSIFNQFEKFLGASQAYDRNKIRDFVVDSFAEAKYRETLSVVWLT